MSAPVENLVGRLHAKRNGKGWVAKCPAHDDRKPSLSIDEGADGRALLHCHGGCSTDEVLAAVGLTKRDLFPAATYQPSGNGAVHRARATPKPAPFDWQSCVDAFTDKHVEQIAKWRGFAPEFVRELRDSGHIGIYDRVVAFPVHNGGKIVGAHFRRKNGKWEYEPKGCVKAAPMVFGELLPGERVQVFESTWDGLDYLDKSGERDGVIIARGASNAKLAAAMIPEGATAFVWTQNDAPGEKWEHDICANTKATVKRAKIPAPHKDLNDWTRAGATDRDLLGAIVNAETLREAEHSWNDALAKSVVTSRELGGLTLTPRNKLLADWFCEGDLGFIFAFRGVGKTWLALAIAEALSTAGKLGDWKAPERVKVLYVDGEMPPDLMRDRAQGLEGNK